MQVWIVRFSDGGGYEGINTVHQSEAGAKAEQRSAYKRDKANGEAGFLSYYVVGPHEVLN